MFYKLLTSLLVVVFPSFKGNAQNAINSSTRKEQIWDYQQLIQLLVVHDQQRVHYSKEVERTFTIPTALFENGTYYYAHNRDGLKPDNPQLIRFVVYDILVSDQYLIPIQDIINKEYLWHWLSVFVGNNNVLNIRHKLTDTIYNDNYIFDVGRASLIFSETDHLIYLIDFIGEPAIGILKKTDFETVSQLCKKLDIKYYELNGQKEY